MQLSHARPLLLSLATGILIALTAPSTAQAFCEPPVEVFWVSVEDSQEVALETPIWIAHSRGAAIRVELNDEELQPVEAREYYSQFAHPTGTQLGDATLTIHHDVLHPKEETVTIQVRYNVISSTSEDLSEAPLILNASEVFGSPKGVCSRLFYNTTCWDQEVPTPYELQISNQPSAFFVQAKGSTGEWQDYGVLRPKTCAPLFAKHQLAREVCYRVVYFDESGERLVGEPSCNILNLPEKDSRVEIEQRDMDSMPDHEHSTPDASFTSDGDSSQDGESNPSCSTVTMVPSNPKQGLGFMLLGACLLGLSRRLRITDDAIQSASSNESH